MRVRVFSFLALPILSFASCSKNASKTPTIVPLEPCSSDGQVDCITTDSFPGTIKATLVAKAGEIKVGTTIGGVAGTMPACAGDNGTNCYTTPEFPSVVKAAISAAGIKSGLVVAGITGTFAPACTTDGQESCLTSDLLKAGDTSAVSVFDLRGGKSIAGYASAMTFARNGADTSTFNRTAGSGSVASAAVADNYDSIDDSNPSRAFPTAIPSTASALTGNWLRDPVSDTNADGLCSGGEQCVYIDRVTNRYWRPHFDSKTWDLAITDCDELTYGTYSDWRMPTQKELFKAYIDGIYSQKIPLGIQDFGYKSATTDPFTQANFYAVVLATGESSTVAKAASSRYLCVRGLSL